LIQLHYLLELQLNKNEADFSVLSGSSKNNFPFSAKKTRRARGPVATVSECQGKNLASALTVTEMNFLFEKGMDMVTL
jgi:hypothetical protein